MHADTISSSEQPSAFETAVEVSWQGSNMVAWRGRSPDLLTTNSAHFNSLVVLVWSLD